MNFPLLRNHATTSVVKYCALFILGLTTTALASEPDWSEGVEIPETGRANIYDLPPAELSEKIRAGRGHALVYPVDVTGILIPERTFTTFIEGDFGNPLRRFIQSLFREISGYRSVDQTMEWLGLHEYPTEEGEGPFFIPFPGPDHTRPNYRMGYSRIERHGENGLTFSCAACHSSNLFGRKIIGLQNRFPRPNEFFIAGKAGLKLTTPELFALGTGASAGEMAIFEELRENARYVDSRKPVVLGLDNSLSQVALSLARRSPDEIATRDPFFLKHPREERLRHEVSTSKPGAWWNLKYKNRWLLDGSVVSGNPIFTNFLWNEIGRGVDTIALEKWLDSNRRKIDELTAAVFAAEAPRLTDFVPAERIQIDGARRGEGLFNLRCAKCHGHYDKAWSLPNADQLSRSEQLRTTLVRYHAKTPVIDVGTDSKRNESMTSMAAGLNPLRISIRNGTVIRPQKGYVPPPLVGIFSRFPYFHNNSAPSLCAVLTPAAKRPKTYYAGNADRLDRDFDWDCVGYPVGSAVPETWRKNPEALYDTTLPGLSNRGHDEKILTKNGKELLSASEKSDLIEFLKTL